MKVIPNAEYKSAEYHVLKAIKGKPFLLQMHGYFREKQKHHFVFGKRIKLIIQLISNDYNRFSIIYLRFSW